MAVPPFITTITHTRDTEHGKTYCLHILKTHKLIVLKLNVAQYVLRSFQEASIVSIVHTFYFSKH